ncbi:MAG: hypothetical protein CFE21_05530 [Bacteroidetes bacterium B1(2017)]|nr:MAG: hypothetical protein CFE21_05530 [Bacteroidetes bacterium B1(2017)]
MKKFLFALVFALSQASVWSQTALPTFWSFTNPSPTEDSTICPSGWKTRLNITVTGTTPYTYSAGSDGNASCRLDGQNEYVQIWFAEKPGTLSYYLKGTGINPNPAFSGTFSVQESVDGTSWTDLRSLTAMTGAFVKYTETPAATSRYVRFFYTTKVSGSNVALDSVYLAKPTASTNASINVKRSGVSLVNGGTQIIGNTASTVFTIKNEGTVNALTISSIALSGMNASDYSISNAPTSIAANDSANFTLNFNLTNAGSRFATFTINSNSTDNSTYAVNLYGIAGPLASQPTSQASAMTFTNLKAYTFNVGFSDPTPKPDAYLVLRKKGSPITEVPVDGQTYLRGDNIGSAQVAYIGSANSFKPSYIVAGTTYYFAVFSINGPAGFENYLTGSPLTNSTTTPGGNPGAYYGSINPYAPNFISQLSAKINVHDTIFYSNYTSTIVNNFLTRDTIGGTKVVNCVYSSIPYIYNEPFVWWGNGNGTLTREHTYPQSWMPSNTGGGWPIVNGKELPEYNDQHHLFPADQLKANGLRSNNPFGEVVTITTQNGEGKLGKDSANKTVYEPRDSQKGDVARALFYMCTTYNGVNGVNWGFSSAIGAKQTEAILKKWHQQDPPDAFEIARNEYIASSQKNRNPFIDHPEWAARINFNTMTYIPVDTTGPKKPLIVLQTPVSTDIWEKGKQSKISWTSTDVDTIQVYFSDDSLKTQTLMTTVPAKMDSILFTSGFVYSHPSGIVILKDKYSATADTSNYFKLSMVNGIGSNLLSSNISIYPNPAKDELFIDGIDASMKANYVIYNFAGIKLVEGELSNQNKIDIKELNEGYFVMQIHTENGTLNKVFIKN